jgi:hypothetical protein
VNQTAKVLGLDYYSLKERVEGKAPQSGSVRRSGRMPAFVELAPPVLAAPGQYVIELENAGGARMRLHLKGAAIADVVAIGRGFWEAK